MKKHLIFLCSMILFTSCEKPNTLLRNYVQNNNPAFQYEIKKVVDGDSWKEYIVKMTSQTWLTTEEVEQVEWWHYLTIVIPDFVEETEALMFIGGGNNKNELPESVNPGFIQVAMATKSIVANITNIPFQPLVYKNDSFGERYEDDLIAFGWRKYLEGGAKDKDTKWLAHLPMTKAVARGMDVVQEIAESQNKPVNQFVTSGASKRGWTTWTTAIADDRVMAIIPIVIDLLNVVPSFNHHWKCYGEWSYAVDSYVNEGIMEWMGSKEFDQMLSVMEPYNYIDQLDLPKFLINATGDEFFVTDSWQFYWNDLKGDKHLQYIPNTSHGLKNTEGDYDLKSLTAFYKAVITDTELPNYEWHVSQDSIFLKVDHNNYAVKQWEAVNKETRDFRVDTIDRTWVSETLQQSEDGSYAVKISQPETGYKAGLLEITFNPDSDIPYIFTTGTVVSPNTFPFGDFKSENPKGTR